MNRSQLESLTSGVESPEKPLKLGKLAELRTPSLNKSRESTDDTDSYSSGSTEKSKSTTTTATSLKMGTNLPEPPTVTSRAWCIVDGHSGELLWGKRDAEQREVASLTKIMTAFVVSKVSQRLNLDIENTMLTVSRNASRTPGTTANLREGDCLCIKDLLYGLMLPSGNDAAVVFAEHFGRFFFNVSLQKGKAKKRTCSNPIKYFLQEMNRFAKILGLNDTHYANPHGLSNNNSRSTAFNVAKLASIFMEDPLLRKVVNTKSYTCMVDRVMGSREVTWVNTNKLLGTEGWDGVKTGITNPAGPCFCGSFKKDNYYFIICILSAKTMDIRWHEMGLLSKWAMNRIASLKDVLLNKELNNSLNESEDDDQ
mmetsp:Transcript_65457/g.75277  ORF Transcript_65457/g.75277 Transcript_65457/m.75277 type:complete len:368 (-) Transcript_65457:216-1319(-)